jgi:hypothetical protein
MKSIVQIVLAGVMLMTVAYTGGRGSDGDRCLWPTDPSVPECTIKQMRWQPT